MPRAQGKQRAAGDRPACSKAAALLSMALAAFTQLAAADTAAATALPPAARSLATSSENPCPILRTACTADDECEECVASVEAAVQACAADPSTSATNAALDTCDDSAAICCGLEADGGACIANTWFFDYMECVAADGECATDINDCVGPTPSPTSGASSDLMANSRGVAACLFSSAAAAGLLASVSSAVM
eukprot:g10146.t1